LRVSAVPRIDVPFPAIERWAGGNTGIAYAWRFEARAPGPSLTVQALTHGNEVCGAVVLDELLARGLRPARGTLTLVFANAAAYESFDRAEPYAARCIDEDFNRLWDDEHLDAPRRSVELDRARELRPLYDATDYLLDLHSMTDPCAPLALAGRLDKGVALARAVGTPAHIVVDAGHRAGKRLRDYAFFDDPADARAALLVECGQHWERTALQVAREATLRFLRHFDALPAQWCAELAGEPPPQRVIEVVDVVTLETDDFEFLHPVHGLMCVPRAGTALARDGARRVCSPCDDCVLIMPSRRPRRGETAVRLGRFVDAPG
jgi:hypothetical protein